MMAFEKVKTPSDVVNTSETWPFRPAGTTIVKLFGVLLVGATVMPPIVTEAFCRFEPVMVTDVPPPVLTTLGESCVIEGA